MELYIGGFAQGKLSYVINNLKVEQRQSDSIKEMAFLPDCTEETVIYPVLDGEKLGAVSDKEWQQYGKQAGNSPLIFNHFHLWIRNLIQESVDVEQQLETLLRHGDGLIVISDEVGNGVVPVDKDEREYRERVGRCLIRIAEAASRVERIMCGLGQRIKG